MIAIDIKINNLHIKSTDRDDIIEVAIITSDKALYTTINVNDLTLALAKIMYK